MVCLVPDPAPEARPWSPLRDRWVLNSEADPTAFAQYQAACASLFDIVLQQPDEPFHNQLEAYNVGGVVMMRCKGVAQTFTRTFRHLQTGDQDQLMLIVSLSGVWGGDYDGRFIDRTMGSVRVVDMARTFQSETSEFETFHIMMPRALLRGAEDVDVHGMVMAEDRPSIALLTKHLNALWDAMPGLSAAEGTAGVEVIPRLLTSAVLAGAPLSGSERRGLPATVLTMARREVDRSLDDESLTPATLATRLGIGRSGLYRMMEDLGGVAAFIQGRRLDKAFDAILKGDGLGLAKISENHGFKSPSHFNRAFRTRFGAPPGEMRRRFATDQPPSATEDPSAVFAWLKRL